jgi:hypothetical protein
MSDFEEDELNTGTTEGAELADELRDEPVEKPERLSVRDALEKSWKEAGGELPENRKSDSRKQSVEKSDSNRRDATAKGAPGKTERVTAESVEKPAAAPQPSSAPNGWSAEAKAEWSRLPPHVQAAVTKRETEMSAGARQLQERYGGIHKIVSTQLTAPAQKYGLTPDRILENALSWFQVIEQNPAQGLAALARTYNIDASKLGTAAPAPANGASNGSPQQQQYQDPRVDQIARTVMEMQQRGQQDATQAELRQWSANKPHFDKVRLAMAQIVSGAAQLQDTSILTADGASVDLDKVYEKAIWMDPEIRSAVIKEQQEAARAARQQQADQARKAGSSVRPGTPGSGSARNGEVKPKKGESVRDTIKRAMAELRS